MEETDLAGVNKLRTLIYPHYPEAYYTDWHESVWNWLGTHPAADHMHRWVVAAGDEIVGHLAATPQYYRVNGHRVLAHTPADYQVMPQYGFQALSIMRKFFRTVENCVACDMVPTVIAVETRLGAVEAGKMQYAAKLLDVSRLPSPTIDDVRGLFSRNGAGARGPYRGFEEPGASAAVMEQETAPPPKRPRAPIPAPVKGLLNRGLALVDEALGGGMDDRVKVSRLSGAFDASFDELFEDIAAVVPCIPEKDAAFLNWRYGPSSPQHPVTVLVAREGVKLLGYAVLRVTREGEDGYILDLTAKPGRHDAARALLRETVREFREQGVHIIRYRFSDSPTSARAADLWRLGFFPRNDRSNTLLVKLADKGLHETARDIANWSYDVGDGEATFWVR